MLNTILIAVAVIVVLFVIIVALRPGEFRVERSATMRAPAGVVFDQVNDLRKWEGWSPWEKVDPAMKKTFAGPSSGVGASYSWVGNNKVGEGRMTVVESRPNDLIRLKLEFFKPFKATNVGEFKFESKENQTTVAWSMSGECNFMMKAMGLFMNCDKMCGREFEKGLAQMKSLAEAAKPHAAAQAA